MSLIPEQRHRHTGLSGDGERVHYEDLVLPTPKWCRRIGNPFVNGDSTNDQRMLANSAGVTITKSGLYDIDASADLSGLWTTYDWSIAVNGTGIRQCFVSGPYGFTRCAVPSHLVADLKVGDLVTISPAYGTLGNTSGTFLEVRERP